MVVACGMNTIPEGYPVMVCPQNNVTVFNDLQDVDIKYSLAITASVKLDGVITDVSEDVVCSPNLLLNGDFDHPEETPGWVLGSAADEVVYDLGFPLPANTPSTIAGMGVSDSNNSAFNVTARDGVLFLWANITASVPPNVSAYRTRAYQDVNVSSYTAIIDAAAGLQFEYSGWFISQPDTVTGIFDRCHVLIHCLNSSGVALTTHTSDYLPVDMATYSAGQWQYYQNSMSCPSSTRTLRFEVHGLKGSLEVSTPSIMTAADGLTLRAIGVTTLRRRDFAWRDVMCEVTSAQGHRASCSFSVTVTGKLRMTCIE